MYVILYHNGLHNVSQLVFHIACLPTTLNWHKGFVKVNNTGTLRGTLCEGHYTGTLRGTLCEGHYTGTLRGTLILLVKVSINTGTLCEGHYTACEGHYTACEGQY